MTINYNLFITSISIFFLSTFFLKLAIPRFFQSFVVEQSSRSSHKVLTPSAGGIVFIIPITILLLSYDFTLGLPLLISWLMGLIDDYRGIPPFYRLLIQGLTSSIIFAHIFNGIDTTILYILFPFIVFIGVALSNFVNFMTSLS